MTLQYVYPRLPRSVARHLLDDLSGTDLQGAQAMAALEHPAAAPIATGGQHVPPEVIERTAFQVRSLAEELGYPAPLPRMGVALFDQPCGDVLVNEMRIVPADAASEDVWSFMTLVVLPDIAMWRFTDLLPERFLGLPRNTFRRLWWRSFTLQDENRSLVDGPDPLGEDELVNIFERPSLSRSAGVARAMARAVRASGGSGVSRTSAMRELAKRMRRLVSFMALDVITNEQLEALISQQLAEAINALQRDVSAPAAVPSFEPSGSEATARTDAQEGRTQWRTVDARQPSRPPTSPSASGPQVVRAVADEDRVEALLKGESVFMILRDDSRSQTLSAELKTRGQVVEIRYTLRGHNSVSGELREYRHQVSEGPAAALAWLRAEHEEVLAGNRPPPVRDLRQELD